MAKISKVFNWKDFSGGVNLPLTYTHFIGQYSKRWYMRVVCWFGGHQRKRVCSYGIRYLQCKRCGKEWFSKGKYVGKEHKFTRYQGEVGQLYGVKFLKKGIIKKHDKRK